MRAKDLAGKLPFITEEGFLDLGKLPIESILKQALSPDPQQCESAVSLLGSVCRHERPEAGVFLIGLLAISGDDWEKRTVIVKALGGMQSEACVSILFDELRRIKSSNTTRRYLKEVIKVLSRMPPELVQDGFESLLEDRSFTPRMRKKFEAVLEEMEYKRFSGFG